MLYNAKNLSDYILTYTIREKTILKFQEKRFVRLNSELCNFKCSLKILKKYLTITPKLKILPSQISTEDTHNSDYVLLDMISYYLKTFFRNHSELFASLC